MKFIAAAFLLFTLPCWAKVPVHKKLPVLSVFIGNDTVVNCNTTLDLIATVKGASTGVTYSWKLVSASAQATFTSGSADKKNFQLKFLDAAVFVFSVTIVESATGSEARDEITVTVKCNTPPPPATGNIKYSRMFSPNNDGINDVLKIEGVAGVNNTIVVIYNQYGKQILSVTNPATNVIWDGKVNGIQMKPDTYYFAIWRDGKKILADNFALLR
jgi:gliding motility-associated-like protein